MKVLALTVALLFAGAGIDAAECVTPAKVGADIKTIRPATVFHEIASAKVAAWMRAFNAIPPVTALVADHIIIFSHEGLPYFVGAFFSGGCLVHAVKIWPPQMRMIEEKIAGRDI